MEVHHPHSPSGKRFKHYMFEFLMLFLAVFAGFIAENIREHVVEKKRIRQYMQSLVLDLKSDVLQLQEDQVYRHLRYMSMDSEILLLNSPERSENTSRLYHYLHKIIYLGSYIYNDRTIQQLKNSGNLRLIKSSSVSDSIMDYDSWARYIPLEDRQEYDLNQSAFSLERKIFRGDVIQSMIKDSSAGYEPTHEINGEIYFVPPSGNPPLMTSDATIINEFIVQLQLMKSASSHNSFLQVAQIARMKRLMEMIKKEYHLE